MKLETGVNEKSSEGSTVVPIQTLVPAIPYTRSQKWPVVTTLLFIALLGVMAFALYVSFSPEAQYSITGDAGFSEVDYDLLASAMQTKQNFNLRIDIDGEKCTESVHADDRQNLVTFHYTGENGREGGLAMYDFNQGLAALKDSNGTACFFMNAYDLPVIQLSDLQLKARNKEVMAIREEVTMEVNGAIPDGFLQVSAGPLFADLCQDLSSYWLVLATDHTTEDSRNRKDGLTLSITVPAGATAAVIVLDGSAAGGTFVISLPK